MRVVDGNHYSKSLDVDASPLKRMGQKNVGVSQWQFYFNMLRDWV